MSKAIPDVRPGQVWADNDPRVAGRTLRVESVTTTHAVCVIVTHDAQTQRALDEGSPWVRDRRGKITRIMLARFFPTSTGYRLVRDVEAGA